MTKKAGKTTVGNMSAGRVARRVFLLLIVTVAVVFAAFYLVGYSMPYEDNASYNAPLLTDVLIWLVYILIGMAAVLTAVSVAAGIKAHSAEDVTVSGLPAARIAYTTAGVVAGVLLLTFALGSSTPVQANGMTYDSAVWLRLSDMFIHTSEILIGVAVACVAFGVSGLARRGKSAKKS